MSTNTIDTEKTATPEPGAPQAKGKRTAAKKAKPTKKVGRAKKPATKPKADRANKKAEVIAMMKCAKGATLAEIMAATGWQAHTFRGVRQPAGQQRRGKDQIVKERRRRAHLSHRKVARAARNAPQVERQGGVFHLCRPHCSASDVTDRRRHLPTENHS
jgi:predicted methyltransferase